MLPSQMNIRYFDLKRQSQMSIFNEVEANSISHVEMDIFVEIAAMKAFFENQYGIADQ